MISLTRLVARRQFHTTRALAADFASNKKPTSTSVAGSKGLDAEDHTSYTYTKQVDETPEPRVSHTGTRTYVVSPKESASYDVPGAYGSSDPYLTPPRTPAPQTSAYASTATGTAHPNTTARVPHNPDGVGESSSVRFQTHPFSSSSNPGSHGGLGLMDAAGTRTPGRHTLADRNSPPSEEGGILGNSEAWKGRK